MQAQDDETMILMRRVGSYEIQIECNQGAFFPVTDEQNIIVFFANKILIVNS